MFCCMVYFSFIACGDDSASSASDEEVSLSSSSKGVILPNWEVGDDDGRETEYRRSGPWRKRLEHRCEN